MEVTYRKRNNSLPQLSDLPPRGSRSGPWLMPELAARYAQPATSNPSRTRRLLRVLLICSIVLLSLGYVYTHLTFHRRLRAHHRHHQQLRAGASSSTTVPAGPSQIELLLRHCPKRDSDLPAPAFLFNASRYRIYNSDAPDNSLRCTASGVCDGRPMECGQDGLGCVVCPAERQKRVREAIAWTWSAYRNHSWGHDEFDDGPKGYTDWLAMGMTAVDGLDTLLLAGLTREADEAAAWVRDELSFHKTAGDVNVFEATIRVVGGLLSAYQLGGRQPKQRFLLERATELAELLLPALDTPLGISKGYILLRDTWVDGSAIRTDASLPPPLLAAGPPPSSSSSSSAVRTLLHLGEPLQQTPHHPQHWQQQQQQQAQPQRLLLLQKQQQQLERMGRIKKRTHAQQQQPAQPLVQRQPEPPPAPPQASGGNRVSTNLAMAGSLILEMSTLSRETGRPVFRRAAERFYATLPALDPYDGLYCEEFTFAGTCIDWMGRQYSVSARSDSAYEYFLKQWLLSGKKEQRFLDLYVAAMRGMRRHLLFQVPTREGTTVGQVWGAGVLSAERPQYLSGLHPQPSESTDPGAGPAPGTDPQAGAEAGNATATPAQHDAAQHGVLHWLQRGTAAVAAHGTLGLGSARRHLLARLARRGDDTGSRSSGGAAGGHGGGDAIGNRGADGARALPRAADGRPDDDVDLLQGGLLLQPGQRQRQLMSDRSRLGEALESDKQQANSSGGGGGKWVTVKGRGKTSPAPGAVGKSADSSGSSGNATAPRHWDEPLPPIPNRTVASFGNERLQLQTHHLSCFLPGLLALGAMHGVNTALRPGDDDDMMLAARLAAACYELYRDPASGVAYESALWLDATPRGTWTQRLRLWVGRQLEKDPEGARSGAAGAVTHHRYRSSRAYTGGRPALARAALWLGRKVMDLLVWVGRGVLSIVPGRWGGSWRRQPTVEEQEVGMQEALAAAGAEAARLRAAAGEDAIIDNGGGGGGEFGTVRAEGGGGGGSVTAERASGSAGGRRSLAHDQRQQQPQPQDATPGGAAAGAASAAASRRLLAAAAAAAAAAPGGGSSSGSSGGWFSLPHQEYRLDWTDRFNLQRPEFVESLFYLYRATGDPVYREWGWTIFRAFEAQAKLPSGGYVSLFNVMRARAVKASRMQSFWLAETLKYLYLLFEDDPRVTPLDTWVFNTEAHPLRVWEDGGGEGSKGGEGGAGIGALLGGGGGGKGGSSDVWKSVNIH